MTWAGAAAPEAAAYIDIVPHRELHSGGVIPPRKTPNSTAAPVNGPAPRRGSSGTFASDTGRNEIVKGGPEATAAGSSPVARASSGDRPRTANAVKNPPSATINVGDEAEPAPPGADVPEQGGKPGA